MSVEYTVDVLGLALPNKLIFQVSDGGVREAVLTALRGVIKHAGKSVSSAVRSRLCTILKDLLQLDGEEVQVSTAKVMGTLSQVWIYCHTILV